MKIFIYSLLLSLTACSTTAEDEMTLSNVKRFKSEVSTKNEIYELSMMAKHPFPGHCFPIYVPHTEGRFVYRGQYNCQTWAQLKETQDIINQASKKNDELIIEANKLQHTSEWSIDPSDVEKY